jgi:hypothetical protein
MIVLKEYEAQYWQLIKHMGLYNDRWEESLDTKYDIIADLISNLDIQPSSILFVTFNPIALKLAKKYPITIICNSELKTIFDFSNVTKVVDSIDKLECKYDLVIALDEYFSYADSEQSQRNLMNDITKVTNGWLVTTLQDYKNFAPHKKNQIDSTGVNGINNYIILENSIADRMDKQLWDHYWYCIKDHRDLLVIGPTKRRTMYFKQLAKYSSDAGSTQYVIQKNLLYKGFFSKHFEHIITVKF